MVPHLQAQWLQPSRAAGEAHQLPQGEAGRLQRWLHMVCQLHTHVLHVSTARHGAPSASLGSLQHAVYSWVTCN